MTRTLTDHIVNPANDKLTITVLDEPGNGGACHVYSITGFSRPTGDGDVATCGVVLMFQDGPIAEVGVNGITQEALLAVLIDRLEGFNAGKFNSDENWQALTHLREARNWLHARTLARMRRGVEGTHQP